MNKLLLIAISVILFSCGNQKSKLSTVNQQRDSISHNQTSNIKKYRLTSLSTSRDTIFLVDTNLSNKTNDSILKSKIEKIVNITSPFTKEFDLSNFILDSLLGAFGNHYQRINLILKTVQKSKVPDKYLIEGWTEMKNKKTPFNGEIIVKRVLQSNFNPQNFYDSTNFTVKIEATYSFIEDRTFAGTGVFKGNLDFTLVLDKENILHNELWDWWGDGYSNFQYQGIWISPSGEEYKCIFGSGRLENSGDLDVGDGSFVPNEKYYQYGWADFFKE